jgi:hypothetical protein
MIQRTAQRDKSQDQKVETLEVRGSVAFAPSSPAAAPQLPAYVIRGGQVFRSEWHPDGPSKPPVFEIRGDQMFDSVWT